VIPAELNTAIAAQLRHVSRRDLAHRAQAMSQHYRANGGSAAIIRDELDVAAYLTARLPATFAAAAAALGEVATVMPEFAPGSLLDIGAGPGSASWASVATWPALAAVTMIDANFLFLDAAKTLTEASSSPALRQAAFVHANISEGLGKLSPAELVISAYALVELSEDKAVATAAAAWERCEGVLLVVEPGTSEGFRRIRLARDALLHLGAHVVAPCPHELACPIAASDWCHFSQRLARSRDHMSVKDAKVPFEDEKYSYVALSRSPVTGRPAARVLRPARVSKVGWAATLCGQGRVFDRAVARREPDFARVRKLDWGDGVAEPAVPERDR